LTPPENVGGCGSALYAVHTIVLKKIGAALSHCKGQSSLNNKSMNSGRSSFELLS